MFRRNGSMFACLVHGKRKTNWAGNKYSWSGNGLMSHEKKDCIFWWNITSNLGAFFCEVFDCREQRCFENPILSIHPLFEWPGAVIINNGWIKFKPKGTFWSSLRTSLYHETWHFSRLSWTELTHLFWHLFSWSHQWLKSLSAWSFFLVVHQYYWQNCDFHLHLLDFTFLPLHPFPR